MKISVIICELNPLHFGHKRLIDFAKSISDKVVCVMSGNFTQRGLVACCNKYKRAIHAIKAGADLVVELPVVYATASAEDFALGGVKIANQLGADFLVFGSECGDIGQLEHCLTLLDDPNVNQRIRDEMQKGVSYPKAVATAANTDILEKPNNVLALEYLRALRKTASPVVPKTIAREDNFHSAPQRYASSTALRNDASLRKSYTFDFVWKDIDDTVEQRYCEFVTAFLSTTDKDYLEKIADVTEGLHNRIFAADKTHGYEKMMEEIKSKRYTRAKLQRIVTNCVLGITKEDVALAKTAQSAVKVLAVKASETALLANKCLTTENITEGITARADRLYSAFDGETPPVKLVKVD